ncbi:MAG: SWIM zinc finger containing protein [Haloquadratum sp. J07HQX50]|nr:MAG: SWIM zinc finger containing protein [Haloquadratum sp. J07HQX50]
MRRSKSMRQTGPEKHDRNHHCIEPRTQRALTEVMTVVSTNGTPITDSDTPIVSVISASGSSYTVDTDALWCTCPDYERSHQICKHIRRARFALGVDAIDAELLQKLEIDDDFGVHCPGPIVVAYDGGVIDNETVCRQAVTRTHCR